VIQSVLGFVESVLTYLHDLFFPIFGENSWGWAIIALTLIVRIALLPLAIKQTRSMRAMQAIQPQMKELQKKYKVDKDLLKKDPEQYKAKKAKLNEEMMALYKEEGANPAASCLPLIAQAPIFIALFYTLRQMTELGQEGFYFLLSATPPELDDGLRTAVSDAGWPGWLMIVLMSGTMFLSQKQMMARNATSGSDNPMAQQQKILLYVMPVFLAVVSFQFPIGILLYWVTTNFWQVAQQAIILREVSHEAETGELANRPGGEAAKGGRRGKRGAAPEDESPKQAPRTPSPGASSGKKPVPKPEQAPNNGSSARGGSNGAEPESTAPSEPKQDPIRPSPAEDADTTPAARRDHLPRRRGGSQN
jgi:YidC/Oxa1 family membrane protein insertase